MNIGLIDVDGHNFPNLALMRLSAYHKTRGDNVEWWDGFRHYDKVYMSKVFTFSCDIDTCISADEIVRGGTGYKDYGNLPEIVERMFPDYTLYPKWNSAIGFLTRGCIRNCAWCIVPKKEGTIRPAATWEEVKREDSRDIILMDNNILAHEHGLEQIAQMGRADIRVDFNQGLDARLITPAIAKSLSKVKLIRFLRMSCDTSEMLDVIEQATAYLREAGVPSWRFWCYALVQNVEEAYNRVIALNAMGVTPFAQPYRDYDGGEPTAEQRRFARWVNNKALFKSCDYHDLIGGRNDAD